MLEFINDVNLCVLSGRLTSPNGNDTCATLVGIFRCRLHVMLVPNACYDVYDRCMMFRVDTFTPWLSVLNKPVTHLSDRRKPGHFLLTVEFSPESESPSADLSPYSKMDQRYIPRSKRFRFRDKPEDFMTSPVLHVAINENVQRTETVKSV